MIDALDIAAMPHGQAKHYRVKVSVMLVGQ